LKLCQSGAVLPIFVESYAEDAKGQSVPMKMETSFKKLTWP
jgi:hypothetical protein